MHGSLLAVVLHGYDNLRLGMSMQRPADFVQFENTHHFGCILLEVMPETLHDQQIWARD